MTTSIEYTLMAANAYAVKDTVTHENNTIPIPSGWVKLGNDGRNDDTGFTARAYKNTTTGEIVIAYTGTTMEGNLVNKAKDWVLANIPAGTGAFLAPQITDSAKFYLDVLKANPGAKISFTGHSLGGGLASLMAVFFDRPATVFDEAPFEKTADSLDRVEDLQRALLAANYTLPAAFANYEAYAFLNENGAFRPSPTREARDDRVRHYYVRDEILSLLQTFGAQAALLGIGLIDSGKLLTLALSVDTIVGQQYYLEGNATSGNDWGWPGLNGNPVDMHAVQLLDAFLMSPAFRAASQTTPELLQALFTSEFYYAQQSADYNLLSLLVRRQDADEKPLEALAADIARVRNELANPGIGFTLTDLALRMYYAQGFRREISAESGAFQQVYAPLDGGIQITRDPAHEEWTVHGFAELEMWLRGQVDLGAYSLAGIERYSLSDGRSMHATTPNDARNDFLLGGDKADVLQGGDGNDFLFSEGGADWLEGGKGNDILNGSWGQDIYRWRTGDGYDKIIDPDGGWLFINDGLYEINAAGVFTRQGTSNVWTRTLPDNSILTLTHNSPWTLVMEDGSTIQLGEAQDDFRSGDFGIHLFEQPDATTTYTGTSAADIMTNRDQAGLGADAQLNIYTLPDVWVQYQGQSGADFIRTDQANDHVDAGTGNDFVLATEGGSDILYGGVGNDYLHIGNPDPNNDGCARSKRIVPADNRAYVEGGHGDDTITVTRSYLPMALALDGPNADTAYLLSIVVNDFATSWSSAYSGWSRAGDYFMTLPGVPAYTFADYLRDGVAMVRDDQGALNLYALFQLPQAELDSALLQYSYSATRFAPLIAYEPNQNNHDTSGHSLYGGAGNDMLEGGFGADFIDGGADNDALDGEQGDDFLFGGAGDDLILGGEGNDWLDSGDGANTLIGEAGDDQLYGGAGNDTLLGGLGDDTYQFNLGDGVDTLQELQGQLSTNVLRLGGGIAPEEIALERVADDLELRHANGVDKIIVANWFEASGDYLLDRVEFADGAQWSADDIAAMLAAGVFEGGTGDDLLIADGARPLDFVIRARGFSAAGVAPEMAVWLDGTLLGLIQVSSVTFADYTFSGDFTPGQAARLQIGFRNDAIIDGEDRNLYVESVTIGEQVLRPTDPGVMYDRGVGAKAFDGVDVIAGRIGMAWNGALSFDLPADLAGIAADDTMRGHDGDDTLSGGGGGDMLYGGNGDDKLLGGTGADTLEGEAGNDRLHGGADADVLRGGDGDNVLSGDGTPAQRIVVRVRGSMAAGVAPSMTVRLDGVTLGTLAISNTNYADYEFFGDFQAGSESVLDVVFGNDAVIAGEDRNLFVESVQVNGQTLTPARSATYDKGKGNAAFDDANVIAGQTGMYWNGALRFALAAELFGMAGNDTLIGGLGNDSQAGGTGNDFYSFGRGDGSDTWTDFDTTPGNLDTARFGADIAYDQLWFRHVGNDLEARIVGTTDSILVKDWYASSYNRIERFEAGDGRVLLDSQVDALVQAMASFAPPAAGQTSLPANYHDALAPVLAANWQ